MFKKFFMSGSAALLLAATPTMAEAQLSGVTCGTVNSAVCMKWDLTQVGNTIVARVAAKDANAGVIQGFGFWLTPAAYSSTSFTAGVGTSTPKTGSNLSVWSAVGGSLGPLSIAGADLGGGTGQGNEGIAFALTGCGGQSCWATGATNYMEFTFGYASLPVNAFTNQSLVVGFRSQRVPNISSFSCGYDQKGKLKETPNGQQGTGCSTTFTPPGGPGPFSTVPEPSTYALMAAGLLGVFGVARRRRNEA